MKSQKINSLVAPMLAGGGIGVMPTDTMYGIVGSALNKATVQKIYRLRRRNLTKPMIVLISSPHEMKSFGVRTTPTMKKLLKKVWPGPVSVVMPITRFAYLHRGKKTLAFRVPKEPQLRALLRLSGPLVAPSANYEGTKPARTIEEAKKYFDDKIQFYVDAGKSGVVPSTLVAIKNGAFVILRRGAKPVRLL